MSKLDIMSSLTTAFHKTKFQLKKHSPEILITVGVAGTITSTVMACKATTKIDGILSTTREKVDTIHKGMEEGQVSGEEYTQEDGKKDLTIVYTQTAVKLAKLYAPAAILGAASLACIISSHNILRTRNVALATAYTALDKGFKQYRGRVVERFGEAVDRELKYNVKSEEIEERTVDENGNEKVEKKVVKTYIPNDNSVFAKCFDDTCCNWTRDPDMNLFFLKQQQAYANKCLQERGHLFLNEVYDMLGFQRTKLGNQFGWIYDKENPMGDNYIDFDIYDLDDERKRAFVNGYEQSIWLDFNVDGDILSLMP